MTTKPGPGEFPSLDELGRELERVAPNAASIAMHRRRYALIAASVATVAVLIGASFTPPGRALAGEIGSLVGIGDEPSVTADRDAVVIGVGEETSIPYEIVATGRDSHMIGTPPGEAPNPCISLEFPTISGLAAASCLTDAAKADLERNKLNLFVYGAPAELYPEAELIAQGIANADVAAISVEYTTIDGDRVTVPADISDLTDDLAQKIGVAEQSRSYVAFLPPTILEPPAFDGGPLTLANAQQALSKIEVIAYDVEGTELHRESAMHPNADTALTMTAPQGRFADGRRAHDAAVRCAQEIGVSAAPRPGGDDLEAQIDACVADALQQPPPE